MHRQTIIFASLLIIASIVIGAISYVTGAGPLGVLSMGISRLTSGEQMIPSQTLTEKTKAPVAPELSTGIWINSEPLTLKGLHGRVVLIEF